VIVLVQPLLDPAERLALSQEESGDRGRATPAAVVLQGPGQHVVLPHLLRKGAPHRIPVGSVDVGAEVGADLEEPALRSGSVAVAPLALRVHGEGGAEVEDVPPHHVREVGGPPADHPRPVEAGGTEPADRGGDDRAEAGVAHRHLLPDLVHQGRVYGLFQVRPALRPAPQQLGEVVQQGAPATVAGIDEVTHVALGPGIEVQRSPPAPPRPDDSVDQLIEEAAYELPLGPVVLAHIAGPGLHDQADDLLGPHGRSVLLLP